MNRRNRKRRRGDYAVAAVASVGFLLMLTELNGGPWAGTFLGAVMFVAGAVAFLRSKNYLK